MFVYGALMRSCFLHHHMAGATYVGEGRTKGTLIALGRYPGLVDGDGDVTGEIYRLEDTSAHLEALDEIEGFDPADPERSEYVRELREVRPARGDALIAWVYRYNAAAPGAPVVAGGDWRRHAG